MISHPFPVFRCVMEHVLPVLLPCLVKVLCDKDSCGGSFFWAHRHTGRVSYPFRFCVVEACHCRIRCLWQKHHPESSCPFSGCFTAATVGDDGASRSRWFWLNMDFSPAPFKRFTTKSVTEGVDSLFNFVASLFRVNAEHRVFFFSVSEPYCVSDSSAAEVV